jgi:hypothetical protein
MDWIHGSNRTHRIDRTEYDRTNWKDWPNGYSRFYWLNWTEYPRAYRPHRSNRSHRNTWTNGAPEHYRPNWCYWHDGLYR